ncbi:RND family efflux transporter MFP subunit [Prosthecobacter fusiformis]|uniref:RND family efflux transporter MFP subunit n=1 Tax=Prosthecobacter fusiformis TaxID=48464 RepID=A0A4R7RJM7_9BACT|nr:efflux RND transporter periplasmic adaptor subunit [Prosthecobacter fusiformis]TDU64328.1 RND family efflux transporter MFP subunit [Prosthecobacter fusiformis]
MSFFPTSLRFTLLLALLATTVRAGVVPGLILPLNEVKIGTPVEGLVREMLVDEGDTVEAGQPLVHLADDLEKLDVERAEKMLEKAKFDHDAAQKLLKENIGTREEALRKSIEHDLARIQRDAAIVRVKQKTLTAPMQGVVVSRGKEPGEAVQLHEVLLQIVHIRQVEAQFYLEPAQALTLKMGDQKKLRVPSLPEPREITGEVVFLDPRLDAESGLSRVKFRVDNASLRLKAGMRVEADFAQP